MINEDIIAALELPSACLLDLRVPKTLLIEHGAATAADKRRINESIGELRWRAALKPTTVGVPEFRDEEREYLEIAILSGTLRGDASPGRLAELIHRAVPYPVFLIIQRGDTVELSLAHKRWSQAKSAAVVLDSGVSVGALSGEIPASIAQPFLAALALSRQPKSDMFALYQGWIGACMALRAARITGVFVETASPDQAAAREQALADCERLEVRMARLRAAAEAERQIARQVEWNLELQQARAEYAAVRARL